MIKSRHSSREWLTFFMIRILWAHRPPPPPPPQKKKKKKKKKRTLLKEENTRHMMPGDILPST